MQNDYTWLISGEYGLDTVLELLDLELHDNLCLQDNRILDSIAQLRKQLPNLTREQVLAAAREIDECIVRLHTDLTEAVRSFCLEMIVCGILEERDVAATRQPLTD